MPDLPLSGSWVAVTGASSGLGRAAALRLAGAYSAKPILIGRRVENLRELQVEIASRFNVVSEVVAADQSTEDGRAQILAAIDAQGAIAALLAAGVTSFRHFDAETASDRRSLIKTNILGFTELLAGLVTAFKRRPCETSILAVASLGGETSLPYQAVYGASKAYTITLVQALAVELRGTGVSVGAFLPGGIDTPMAAQSDLRWGRLGLMDADRCAALAVDALVRRRLLTVPGLGNRLAYFASRRLARRLVARAAALPFRRPE